MTYDLATDVGKVRLLIGDKVITDPVFTDEELQYFITAQGSLNLAAAEALESWAASYGANADSEGIGDYRYSQNIVTKLLDLAKRLREKEAETPAMAWSEMDLTCGSGITEEED